MKRVLIFVAAIALMLNVSIATFAQDGVENGSDTATTEQVQAVVETAEVAAPQEVPLHEQVKIKFIEGGPEFMGVILLLLVLGLSIAIERIIYLNLATVNTRKLIGRVEDALKNGGIESAKEVCRNTRGPVASIFYQGLDRAHLGLDSVEKSVVSYGSVQMSQLESGLTWMNLFISLAPTFGFMGTVIGMISAFDSIEAAGDIAPSLVAGGIKIALITTVFGLIVAATLQLFYNYLLTKIDSMVMSMEDASISLIDVLVRNGFNK